MLILLSVAIFLVCLGLLLSAAYLLIEAPLGKKHLKTRVHALEQVAMRNQDVPDVLRKDLYSDIPLLNQILMSIPGIPRLSLLLDQAAVRMQVGTFLLAVISLALFGLIFGLVFRLQPAGMLLALVVPTAAPFVIVCTQRSRRFSKFEELFPEAIDLLARAVRAGHAFTTGFELIGKELPDPVGDEFRTTYQQQNLGLPLRDALGNLAIRVPLPDVRIFVSSLQIQRDSGGNLGEILDTLSYVIRERFKLFRQVRVFTAEGRMSMYMLTAIPAVAGLGVHLMSPDYLKPLFTDPRGQTALMVAVIMQIIGYFVIRRIIRIDV